MKIRYVCIALIGSVIFSTGCQQSSSVLETTKIANQTSETNETELQTNDNSKSEGDKTPPILLCKEDYISELDNMNLLYQSQEFDFYEEKAALKIYSYATIINGELQLDDGQQWVALLENESGVYLLFDRYVQHGTIDGEVILLEDSEDWRVIIRVHSALEYSIYEYNYDESDQVFYQNLAYRNIILQKYIVE